MEWKNIHKLPSLHSKIFSFFLVKTHEIYKYHSPYIIIIFIGNTVLSLSIHSVKLGHCVQNMILITEFKFVPFRFRFSMVHLYQPACL